MRASVKNVEYFEERKANIIDREMTETEAIVSTAASNVSSCSG